MKQKVGFLSGGQRQALTLLMATMVEPELLLLDEHTAALDPSMARKVLMLTREIVDEHHLSTLMVTHNMKAALEYGTRTIMMHEGRIILDLQGAERENMTVELLVKQFENRSGTELDNDRLLLS
jgi:putative ABC transport system ATP-binding protein